MKDNLFAQLDFGAFKEYIASNVGTDVRQLEGSITRLVAYSTIMGGVEITLDLAIEALKDFINKVTVFTDADIEDNTPIPTTPQQ